MRCYVIAGLIIFTLILVGHAARVVAEGPAIFHDPMFLVASVLAGGMAVWAAVLLFRRPR